MGLAPKIVYVDCELDYTRLKQLLVKIVDKVKDSRRGCHIVGGGWDASEVSGFWSSELFIYCVTMTFINSGSKKSSKGDSISETTATTCGAG